MVQMKAVILAGGYATRLWPLTKNRAKPLLPLGKKPIIEHILEEIKKEKRIHETIISANKKFEPDFEDYLSKNSYENTKITVEDTNKEKEKPGAIGALSQIIKEEDISGPLLVAAGDNYISFNISDFLDFYEKKQNSCLAAYKVPIEEASQYGVLNVKDTEVKEFKEKPEEPESNLVSIAFYVFSEKGIKSLKEYIKSGKNPDSPGYFIEWLIKNEKVNAFSFDGKWFDIGTPRGYLKAYKSIVGENRIIDSEVKNSKVEKSLIKSSNVIDSEIKNSLIFEETKIENCKIKNTIIDNKNLSNKKIKNQIVSKTKPKNKKFTNLE
ncbi:MAG: N-acetylglucosamine-1-phosphate uridyltransferase [Candidatus Methanohalarchaeum thermophilum]|uniref:N-acetylglucosamine-1-phosphate uridyltransferase n=1 Tax=Methanohalarchaeum thermophilum TaxID=1903181 RepID=A0A1Q6DU90_METT1|nr:MAG: N-acetylglucosamine-1-phosphate uridyltransferase [Candidatus Methanohalarchaeum thermophilum]